jgi:XapX domain-containing protein
MKMYLISLSVGVLVGVIYSLLQVRSPAPPLVALVGLLGILAGEQAIPVGKQVFAAISQRLLHQTTADTQTEKRP